MSAEPETANGCCGGPAWRGRLCDYHQGYEDGKMAEQDDRYTMPTDGLVDLMERIAELEAENQRLSYRVDTWRRVARGALRNHYTLYKGIEKLRDEAENEARDETSRVNDALTYYARRLTELLEDK